MLIFFLLVMRVDSATFLHCPHIFLCANNGKIPIMSLCTLKLQFYANLTKSNVWSGEKKKSAYLEVLFQNYNPKKFTRRYGLIFLAR